jgi:hypothetical protein
MAVLLTGSATGAMLWPLIAQELIDVFGWRHAAFLLGGSAAIAGWFAALMVRENPSQQQAGERHRAGPVLRLAITRPFLVIVAVLFLSSLGQNGAALAGRFAAGYLLDRYFAPRVALCLFAIAAAGALVLAGARSAAAGALGAALVGVGMGAEADITPYLLSRYFGFKAFRLFMDLPGRRMLSPARSVPCSWGAPST